MSLALNLHEIKAELKNHGCKLKTQLDGTWAIHEPKGKRVIVPNLEAVHEYCLSRATKTADVFSSGTVHGQGRVIPQGQAHIPDKEQDKEYASSAVEVTQIPLNKIQPVPDPVPVVSVRIEPVIEKQPEPVTAPEPVIAANISRPVTENVQVPSPQVSVSQVVVEREIEVQYEDHSAIRLTQLRTELKKLGCKLKSQLDGSWCIDESKGRRKIVPTLQAVQDYIDVHNGKPLKSAVTGNIASESEVKVTRPLTAAALDEIQPAPLVVMPEPVLVATVEPVPAAPVKAAPSPEQLEALSIVNQMLRDIKATRLPMGMNFLHSEILPYLQDNNCPSAFIEKAILYAEAKLQKDCMDKVLVKRIFKNHRDQQDAMYFEFRYANVLSAN